MNKKKNNNLTNEVKSGREVNTLLNKCFFIALQQICKDLDNLAINWFLYGGAATQAYLINAICQTQPIEENKSKLENILRPTSDFDFGISDWNRGTIEEYYEIFRKKEIEFANECFSIEFERNGGKRKIIKIYRVDEKGEEKINVWATFYYFPQEFLSKKNHLFLKYDKEGLITLKLNLAEIERIIAGKMERGSVWRDIPDLININKYLQFDLEKVKKLIEQDAKEIPEYKRLRKYLRNKKSFERFLELSGEK